MYFCVERAGYEGLRELQKILKTYKLNGTFMLRYFLLLTLLLYLPEKGKSKRGKSLEHSQNVFTVL